MTDLYSKGSHLVTRGVNVVINVSLEMGDENAAAAGAMSLTEINNISIP